MGHCLSIYFECSAEKDTAFADLTASTDVEIIGTDAIRIIDASSNSDNFITNREDCLQIEIGVKTRILSAFILDKLSRYQCLVKDCEDLEEEPGPPDTFFRC